MQKRFDCLAESAGECQVARPRKAAQKPWYSLLWDEPMGGAVFAVSAGPRA